MTSRFTGNVKQCLRLDLINGVSQCALQGGTEVVVEDSNGAPEDQHQLEALVDQHNLTGTHKRGTHNLDVHKR